MKLLRDKRAHWGGSEICPVDLPIIVVDEHGLFEVDDAVAGRAPVGNSGDEDYDPGEGLLAQEDNYEIAEHPAKKKSAASDKEV